MADQKKILVERRFRRIRDPEDQRSADSLVWDDFGHEHVVVVLGEPGSGKTTEFVRQAGREAGASVLSTERFLYLPLRDPRLQCGVLYLDGLDEMRAGGSPEDVLGRIINKLIELAKPRMRISCRAAEWIGELDRGKLTDASPTSQVAVVELQPLTEKDVEELVRASGIPDPPGFLETARRRGLEDWLGNPQTLELMIKVAWNGALPDTRSQLFEEACKIMVREENRAHRQPRRPPLAIKEILDTAGLLCSLALIAGLGGFAGDQDESDSGFPPPEALPFPPEDVHAALSCRLFRWQEGRATPVHRTIAEFLGARALSDRIRNGLPLARLLRLITGHDGGTLSDLRGLYTWLTTLLPECSDLLATRDAAALIFYGDPEPLPASVKRVVLGELKNLAEREPWFLYDGGHLRAFGGLADPDLIHEFRSALTHYEWPEGYRLAVLCALTYGHPLPALRGDLLEMVRKGDPTKHGQDLAVQALINVTPDDTELLALLEDLQSGVIDDPNNDLRAHLLRHLYPETIAPTQIARYLIPSRPDSLGNYYYFLLELSAQTPNETVPELLDSLTKQDWDGRRDNDPWPDFLGRILVRALELYGEAVPPQRLWSWLQLASDGSDSVLPGEYQRSVQGWFSKEQRCATELYQWWFKGSTERANSTRMTMQ